MTEEYFKGLNSNESAEFIADIKNKYRHVFSGAFGNEVLEDILINLCHFGLPVKDMEQAREQNVAILILGRLGILTGGNEGKLINVLMSVLGQPAKED